MKNKSIYKFYLVLMAVLLASCATTQPHSDAIMEWRSERQISLKRSNGWLTLIGLYWLQEGDNSFGSDPSNTVLFPGKYMPEQGGIFNLSDSVITINVDPGVGITDSGAVVTTMQMLADVTGAPTILSLSTLTFYVIKRNELYGIRIKDSASEALAKFTGLDYFPIDENWRIAATFKPNPDGAMEMTIPSFQGPNQIIESPGVLEFTVDKEAYRLNVFAEEGDEWYFIIFADATSGNETYGGGRFLYIPAADENGTVDLDFNLAYSPPCVFTPYATCPLPPMENRLPFRVEAGEKTYTKGVGMAGEH
jgi:uncharacterized protein (DUF1684 family)